MVEAKRADDELQRERIAPPRRRVQLPQPANGIRVVCYHGAAEAVLKWLARFPVDRIATPQTSLEDAFIQYYRQEADHGD